MDKKSFADRYGAWAIVTGASSGIGRALSYELAKAGLNLILCARSHDALSQIASDITSRYAVKVTVEAIDLSLAEGVENLLVATENFDVGLLVAAAGFGTSGSFIRGDLETEIEMLYLNCRAVMALSWHFGKRFARQMRGGIILMGSIVGFQGVPHAAHYAATKAYVQALGEALRLELAPFGVDVLVSAPGPTHSGFAKRAGMNLGMAIAPSEVAHPTLNSLGKTSTVIPGALSKFLSYSLSPLPRWLRVRIMGQVMKGMTAHQK